MCVCVMWEGERVGVGKGAGKGLFGLLVLGRLFSVLVADYDPTLPMPVFFSCCFYVGLRESTENFESFTSEPSTLTLCSDAPIFVVIVYFTYFWDVFGKQEMKKQNEPKRPNLHLTTGCV